MARCFYRIVVGPVPKREDFVPAKALGKPLFDRSFWREWAEGVSFFADFASAKRTAKRFPKLGSYIAEVCFPNALFVEIVQTGIDDNHLTIYAEPDVLLSHVRGAPQPIDKD